MGSELSLRRRSRLLSDALCPSGAAAGVLGGAGCWEHVPAWRQGPESRLDGWTLLGSH